MRHFARSFYVPSAIILGLSSLSAATIILDGTTNLVYQNTNFVFHSNEAKGFVRLNAGFTVPESSSAYLDTFITVSNGIDLRDTGTLDLLSDLFLSSHFTFSNNGLIGGRLNGRGNTLHLDGDLTLPDNRLLQIISDTVIDGHGNTLTIGAEGQILVDTNTTLTLRNMALKNSLNSENRPMIRMMDQKGKLALKNVTMDLGSDFVFRNGQLFIHDDVVVTGVSKISYKSTLTSYIDNNSTWYFGPGTSLQYYPSAQWKDLIWMKDKTSSLYLEGASLLATSTGVRLTQGRLFLDNLVTLSSMSGQQVTTPTQVGSDATTGNQPQAVDWSPDGRFLAVANTSDSTIQIFNFDGTSTPIQVGSDVPTGSVPLAVAWSPDGRFLAVANSSDSTIQIFNFDGINTPTQVGSDAPTGQEPQSVGWSPNGQFLAVVNGIDNNLQVFSFNGTSTPTQVGGNVATGNNPFSVDWSPDGQFLAVATFGGDLRIFSFDGTSTPTQVGSNIFTGMNLYWADWSPDGRFVAVVSAASNVLQIYSFNGSNTPVQVGSNVVTGNGAISVEWSPDGRFLAVVNELDSNLQLYTFNGSSTPTQVGSNVATGLVTFSGVWSPDGRFIAVVGWFNNQLQVFSTNYVADSPNNTPQAFTNSIVFGNSALGASANLNVNVLSGATVVMDGKTLDDSV